MKAGYENFRDRENNDRDQSNIRALVGLRAGKKRGRRHRQFILVDRAVTLSTQEPSEFPPATP